MTTPSTGVPAIAAAAVAAEEALAPASPRIVRVPWVHGPGGIARDLIVGLRMRRHRLVGPADNLWAMLGADDAAEALVTALGAPPGVYSAAEADIPTQAELVGAICAVPGHRRPDRVPPGLAALSMGGAMSEAIGMSLAVRTGRLADRGWAPRDDWRASITRLAGGSLPLPRAERDRGHPDLAPLAVLDVERVALQVPVDPDPDREHHLAADTERGLGAQGAAEADDGAVQGVVLALAPLLPVDVEAIGRLRPRRQRDRVDGGVCRHGRRTLPHA